MQKTKKKPLTLDKESIRVLNLRHLTQAHGGKLDTNSCTHCSDSQANG